MGLGSIQLLEVELIVLFTMAHCVYIIYLMHIFSNIFLKFPLYEGSTIEGKIMK